MDIYRLGDSFDIQMSSVPGSNERVIGYSSRHVMTTGKASVSTNRATNKKIILRLAILPAGMDQELFGQCQVKVKMKNA